MNNATHTSLPCLIITSDKQLETNLKRCLKVIGYGNSTSVGSLQSIGKVTVTTGYRLVFFDVRNETKENGLKAFHASMKQQGCTLPVVYLVNHVEDTFSQKLANRCCSTVLTSIFSTQDVYRAVETARLQLENEELKSNAQTEKTTPSPAAELKGMPPIFFKVGDKYRRINLNEVSYFYANNKLTYARVGGRNYPTSVQLKVLEKSLSPGFLRCHKKYLINIQKIENILVKEDKIQIGEELLPIGYVYRKPFLASLILLR